MFFIAYAFEGQVHVFTGQVKIVSHLSCRTSAILPDTYCACGLLVISKSKLYKFIMYAYNVFKKDY